METVKVTGTIVEITGDEMAQVIWELVRTRIIDPALEIRWNPLTCPWPTASGPATE